MCCYRISSCKFRELGIGVIVRQRNLLYVQHDFLSRVRDRAYLYRSNFFTCMSMKCSRQSLPMVIYGDHLYLVLLFRFVFHFDSSSISVQLPFRTSGSSFISWICIRATLLKFSWNSKRNFKYWHLKLHFLLIITTNTHTRRNLMVWFIVVLNDESWSQSNSFIYYSPPLFHLAAVRSCFWVIVQHLNYLKLYLLFDLSIHSPTHYCKSHHLFNINLPVVSVISNYEENSNSSPAALYHLSFPLEAFLLKELEIRPMKSAIKLQTPSSSRFRHPTRSECGVVEWMQKLIDSSHCIVLRTGQWTQL